MKRAYFILLIFFIGTMNVLFGEVTLIRRLPDSGTNKTEADWSKPRPQTEAGLAGARTQFSARIILGGQGGVAGDGVQTYDLYSDSAFSLIQPLGLSTALRVEGSALRKRLIHGSEQDYSAGIALNAEKWSLDLSGVYADNLKNLPAGSSAAESTEENLVNIESSFKAGFIPSLPVTLTYSHDWKQNYEDTALTEDALCDSFALTASGSLGPVGVETAGHTEYRNDRLKQMKILGLGGSLAVTIPIIRFFKIKPGLSSSYSQTDYTETGYKDATTAMDMELGLYFPIVESSEKLSEKLEIHVIGGKRDIWSADYTTEGEPETHETVWHGESGCEWKIQSGVFSKAVYSLAKTPGGLLNQEASIGLGWENPDKKGWFNSVEAGGDLSASLDDSGEQQSHAVSWESALLLQPVDSMSLSGSYTGGVDSSEPKLWNHRFKADLAQTPDPLLSYKLGTALSDSISDNVHSLESDNILELILKPSWNLKVYTLSLCENLFYSWDYPVQEEDILSKACTGITIPLFSFIQLRYSFTWEWVNRIAPEGPPGNAYSHLSGLTLSGSPLPFSFSTNYSLSHGFRGLRHDVNSTLDLPLVKGFGLKGSFTLNSYKESGVQKTPFLVGLHGAYEY